jgi:hypothetical protein
MNSTFLTIGHAQSDSTVELLFLAAAALVLLNPILCYIAKVRESIFLKIIGALITLPQLVFLYAALRFSAGKAVLIIVFLLLIQYYFLFSKNRKIKNDEVLDN